MVEQGEEIVKQSHTTLIKSEESHIKLANDNNDEIDLIELVLTFWKERRYIWICTSIFFIFGLIVAFTSNEEYTSQVKLIPESSQSGIGVSLAQQFGIRNLQTSTSEGIPTRFYPDIVQSYPFLMPLLDHRMYYSEINDSISVLRYFNDYYSDDTFTSIALSTIRKYTIGLPSVISGWFKKETEIEPSPVKITEDPEPARKKNSPAVVNPTGQERRAVGRLRSRITVITGQEGIISIMTKMPEPEMAVDLADHVTGSLIEYIKTYRTEKARTDVDFIEKRNEEAMVRFELTQRRLAQFRDQNRGQLTQMARTEEQRLQSEYDLAFNVYSTLARRLEEARLNLQEETPVVKVLEPAVRPTGPSEPKRNLIITMYTILGVFTGFILIFFMQLRRKIINSIKYKEPN
jgi:capsular polysaccharide biosynthesis protein